MAWPTRSSLVFLSLLVLWRTAGSSPTASTAPAMEPAPVRVGLVLDLRSDVGRERRACVSKALHDFEIKYPSYAGRLELLVRDSLGDLAASTHAAEDLIKNSKVQAIIWAPQTLTIADHVSHLDHRHNHIQVISFSNISSTSCAFYPVTTSGGHAKFGLTLGSGSIIFLNRETDIRHNRKLGTRRKMQDCASKTKLKIVVPKKDGFQVFVDVTIDPISKKETVTGYSIDIFEAAMKNLDPRPCYEYIIFYDTSYDELVGNVSTGVYDAAVGDVTITAERVTGTDFTMPYTQSGVSMLVLAEEEPNTVRWTFVKPLSANLWIATIVFFFYTGFVVWMIELPKNQEYQGSSLRQCSTALYFIFSTLTFSHGQIIRSPLSRIVVVIWCFVVLILVQSYTASLSSILTAKILRPSVKDLEQLLKSGDFIGYQDGSFVQSLLMHNISASRLRNYTTKEEYANALRLGSKNGGVSAIVDEIPYINSFLSDRRYNNDFRMVGSLYKTPGFGFAFQLGSPLVHNLSIAILNLAAGKEGFEIEAKWFGTSSAPIGDAMADSGPLTFQSFSGLFVITGSISSLMLLISIARWVYAKYICLTRSISVSYSCVDEESALLQNGMSENPSPDQQSLSGDDNDDLQGVHVSGENAQEGARGPVQRTGMHGGSMPAGHVQIEMSRMSTI